MKSSIWVSCTILYLFFNQVQISSAEPITLTILAAVSGVITIWGYIEMKYDKAKELASKKEQSRFLENLEMIHLSKQQISLSEEIKSMVGEVSAKNTLEDFSRAVDQKIRQIDAQYKDISLYKRAQLNGINFTRFDEEKIIKAAKLNIGAGRDSIYELIIELYDDVIGGERANMVKSLNELIEQNIFNACSTKSDPESSQSNLQKILSGVLLAYLKGYLTIRFSEQFLNQYDSASNVTYSKTLSGAIEKLELVMDNTVSDFKREMERASRDVWLCDPRMHEEDVTFETMRGFIHKQIIPQYLLDKDESCSLPCNIKDKRTPTWSWDPYRKSEKLVYNISRGVNVFGCRDVGQLLDIRGQYNGTIYHYDRMKSHVSEWDMKLRQFKSLFISTDEQRKQFGPDDDGISPLVRIERYDVQEHSPAVDCNICACTTAEPNWIRISLRQTLADEDHVITGVRINRTLSNLHLQIQQGKLLANGAIDQNSLTWKVDDDLDEIRREVFIMDDSYRTIDMHDIDLPSNHVMVGIGFNIMKKSINLKISSRTFNFTTGQINHNRIHEHRIGERNLTPFVPEDMEVPQLGEKSTYSATNISIKFSPSSFLHDLGQTTVPFFDIQDVTTSVPTPMSGAGLYYKFREGFAGYIGIKLKTYDFLGHLDEYSRDPKHAANVIFDNLLEQGDI